MYRLITAIVTLFIVGVTASSQEFTDTHSADLLKRITTRFLRESTHSSFLDSYAEENARYAAGVKSVRVVRGDFYEKEILCEKGFVIAKTESSPFDKMVETFNFNKRGDLLRSSKRTSRMRGNEVIAEETDITSFAYGDTLHELHNYHASPGSARCDFGYTYICDTAGLVVEKISDTHFNIDTTRYEYDALRRVVRETMGNGTVLDYLYSPTGKVVKVEKRFPDGEEAHLTHFSYDSQDRLEGILLQESYTRTEVKMRYDEGGRLVWFSCKTMDGDDVTNEECAFEYDAHGYISKDCRDFVYKYKYDRRGNWVRCDILRGEKRIERITRKFVYEKRKR